MDRHNFLPFLLLLLLLLLLSPAAARLDQDDPLADLEDPLDDPEDLGGDVGLDQEARRAEDGPDASPPPENEKNEENDDPRRRPTDPAPAMRGMQWWAKYAWSAVIGGAGLYVLQRYWKDGRRRRIASSSSSSSSSGVQTGLVKT